MNNTDTWIDMLLAHDAWIRGLARRLVADEHTADDLAQDAWVEAMESPPPRAGSLRGWLGQVVRNLALMHRRSGQRRQARETAAARTESTPSVAQVLEHEATRHELARVVCALEEPYRSAILLRYFEGLPPRKIARRLGVTPAGRGDPSEARPPHAPRPTGPGPWKSEVLARGPAPVARGTRRHGTGHRQPPLLEFFS